MNSVNSKRQLAILKPSCYLLFARLLYNAFMSRTYQPKKKKRARTHGFLARKKSPGGLGILRRRRQKGRRRLTV